MTITFDATHSSSGGDTTDSLTFTIPSATYPLNELVMVCLYGSKSANNSAPTSISGASISAVTRVIDLLYDSVAAPQASLTVFSAKGTGSASAITVTYPQVQLNWCYQLVAFQGIDYFQPGQTNAIVQSKSSGSNTSSATAAITVDATFLAPTNAGVAFSGKQNNAGITTPSTGWTDVGLAQPTAGGALTLDAQYILSEDESFSTLWNISSRNGIIMVEVMDLVLVPAPPPVIPVVAVHRAANW